MEYKFGDELKEGEVDVFSEEKRRKQISLLIILSFSLLIGLFVFFVSSVLLNKNPTSDGVEEATSLSLEDSNVKILYEYVTFEALQGKFLKEKETSIFNFTNQDKFYYALQFVEFDDLKNTGLENERKQKIYLLSSSILDSYMKRFFGSSVVYSKNIVMNFTFPFQIDGYNVGEISYSQIDNGYHIVFDGVLNDDSSTNLVQPYYGQLVEAYRESDGSYRLVEKVIFTEMTVQNGVYTISIYNDYNHTILIDMIQNVTEDWLRENPVSIENYLEKASTVTYLFKVDETTLYFYSSSLRYS